MATKKIAAVVTEYRRWSHADVILGKILEGYLHDSKERPDLELASMYVDQFPDNDMSRELAKKYKFVIYDSIPKALTRGGALLAVDGVLIIGEHGKYADNDKGQKLYPRRRFFEETVKVFRASGRSVPVFNDKHLAWNWKDAKWMYDQSKELGFPMMAGSSVPVTHRKPDVQLQSGVELEGALALGYGHFEVYGFHTLEALQVMTERRQGGETGVKAVQALEGKEAWQAAKEGKWDRKLLEAALARVPKRGKQSLEEDDADALVYLIEYRDGLKAAAYLSPRHAHEFGFAGQVKGEKEPVSCWYELPKPQRDHFSFLTGAAAQMMVTGKATYPVERTLLTTGMLDFLVNSKYQGHKRLETPELAVAYKV